MNMQRIPIDRPRRSGFTLVELLVAITVLALLASLVLVGLAAAEESARVAKTRTTIAKLNAIVMQKYESYRTRRVPVAARGPNETSQEFARRRLDALRELMRMEMPERWTDIVDRDALPSAPAVTFAYRAALGKRVPDVNNLPSFSEDPDLYQFQGAECLFLLVTRGSDDPYVMEQFSASEIGDRDGDGLLEFLDGWNRPISFLRWAPGFSSNLQKWDFSMNEFPDQHDPFDPLKVHTPDVSEPFAPAKIHPPLYPLIYSIGPDGVSGIADENAENGSPFQYSATSPKNSPYAAKVGDDLIGWIKDAEGAVDNITNHDGIQ